MRHPLTALILACLLFSFGLTFITAITLPRPHTGQTKIDIQSTQKVGDIITAIEALKRPDVKITSRVPSNSNPFTVGLGASFGFFLMTAIILGFFKVICRCMGISPTI